MTWVQERLITSREFGALLEDICSVRKHRPVCEGCPNCGTVQHLQRDPDLEGLCVSCGAPNPRLLAALAFLGGPFAG